MAINGYEDLDDTKRIQLLLNNVEGDALEWSMAWRSDLYLPIQERRPFLRNYSAFCDAFLRQYSKTEPRRTAAEQLLSLKQTGSAAVYAKQFESLLARCCPDMPHEFRCYMFAAGLKPQLQTALSGYRFHEETNPAEAYEEQMETAISMDNRAYRNRHSLENRNRTSRGVVTATYKTDATSEPMDLNATQMEQSSKKTSQEERERRRAEKLCFFCGGKHFLRECPERPEQQAKMFRNQERN